MGDEFGEIMGARSHAILEAFILDDRIIVLAQSEIRSD